MAIISIPQEIGVLPNSVIGGAPTLSVTISVDQAGGSVQLDTDQRSVLVSPSGDWPHLVSFAAGGPTSQTVVLSTSQVVQNTQAKVFTVRSGVDTTNPANWAAVVSVVIPVNPMINSTDN